MSILRFAPLLALAAAPIVHAADSQPCSDETVTAIARWAGIANARIATRDADRLVVASSCKVMPNAPETTIAAVAFDSLPKSKNPDESKKLQVVALVEGGKVVAADRSVVEEDVVTEIDENSYRIDTAPYRLSPDVRAFGVVFTSSARGPSCPDANTGEELTLWVREGGHIRPVFGTNLYGWVSRRRRRLRAGCGRCAQRSGPHDDRRRENVEPRLRRPVDHGAHHEDAAQERRLLGYGQAHGTHDRPLRRQVVRHRYVP